MDQFLGCKWSTYTRVNTVVKILKFNKQIHVHTPIANMATISPKRGFSVVTVAKGWPALFFQEFCRLYTEKLDAEIERKARSRTNFIEILQNTLEVL